MKSERRGWRREKKEEVAQQNRHYRHGGGNCLKGFSLSHDGFCDGDDGNDANLKDEQGMTGRQQKVAKRLYTIPEAAVHLGHTPCAVLELN